MTPLILSSVTIPAVTVFVLIALIIQERGNFFPKRTNTNVRVNANMDQNQASNRREKFIQGKRYPDDFLDFSGGTMGI